MGSILSLIIPAIVLSGWPCLLSLGYTKYSHITRFILQWLFVIPFTISASILVVIVGLFVKYLTFKSISNATRIYILSTLTDSFWQIALFAFEFWSNVRYVVSDENVTDDIFHLNSMLLCNHSESPFDWLAIASVADYLERLDRAFVFMKKAFMFVPAIGWVGSLGNAIPLERNWANDKIKIAKLAMKFKENIDYKLVTPWMWYSYPEGTRFSASKLAAAQKFAKERGFPIYKNVLQPRVKGFSYLTHHLYDSLSCIIDTTVLYHPLPPQAKTYFIGTRFCKYIHVHLRVYRKNNFPKEIEALNKWLRDRWTEKDVIIGNMKQQKINFKILKRSPLRAIKYYIFFALVVNYLVSQLMFGLHYASLTSLLILISSLFPVIIVLIEQSQNVKFD